MVRKSLHSPEVVLFDWDNTLIDSWETNRLALNTVYKHFNKPELSTEEVKARPQIALQDSFPIVFGNRWQEARQIYYEAYTRSHLEMLTPHEGAEDLLSYLHHQNIYLAVVSNKLGDNLRKEINHLGWNNYFKAIVGAKDTNSTKPHWEPLEKALAHSIHKKGPQIWFIGDSTVDMECALHIEATPIFLGSDAFLLDAKRINPSLFHTKNLKEIINILKNTSNYL